MHYFPTIFTVLIDPKLAIYSSVITTVGNPEIVKYDMISARDEIKKRLKDQEDKWICRLGIFHPPHGLNTRDEIKTRSRAAK